MNIPASKYEEASERLGDLSDTNDLSDTDDAVIASSLQTHEPSEPTPSSPPPLPESAEPDRGGLGFTSVIRHLSLRGWLRWIHSNQSDATLSIRTREGGAGRIWCVRGKIVDAEWGAFNAESALREILSLAAGAVTIDFDPVERPRRIVGSMRELLALDAAPRRLPATPQTEAALAAARTGLRHSSAFRSSLFVPLASGQPTTRTSLPWSRPEPRTISRGEYLAALFLLAALAVAAFTFGRMRATSGGFARPVAGASIPAEQVKSGLLPPRAADTAAADDPSAAVSTQTRGLATIHFSEIEVEPTSAEIWLDQALVGSERISLAPMHDGAMHELRFTAPGYEARSIFFRDAAPAGRVILERSSARESAKHLAPGEGSKGDDTSVSAENDSNHGDAAEPTERRLTRKSTAITHARAAAPSPAPTPKASPAQKPPQVQLIEVRTPRVQVLD